VGSGSRSEKVRTYNFPNNRITDHRIKKEVFGMDAMLSGELLDQFHEKMILEEELETLVELESKI
jgi:peptide chain release factor 1